MSISCPRRCSKDASSTVSENPTLLPTVCFPWTLAPPPPPPLDDRSPVPSPVVAESAPPPAGGDCCAWVESDVAEPYRARLKQGHRPLHEWGREEKVAQNLDRGRERERETTDGQTGRPRDGMSSVDNERRSGEVATPFRVLDWIRLDSEGTKGGRGSTVSRVSASLPTREHGGGGFRFVNNNDGRSAVRNGPPSFNLDRGNKKRMPCHAGLGQARKYACHFLSSCCLRPHLEHTPAVCVAPNDLYIVTKPRTVLAPHGNADMEYYCSIYVKHI